MSIEATQVPDAPAEIVTSIATLQTKWGAVAKLTSADQAQIASDDMNMVKDYIKGIEDYFEPMISQAHSLHKALCNKRNEAVNPAKEFVKVRNRQICDYRDEVQRIAQEEADRINRENEEIARKKREKEEAEAAKQREIEAEARRKAEAARLAAEAEEDEKKRAKLLAEAAKAEVKADTAAERAEERTANAASIQAPSVFTKPVETKIAGSSFRETWTFEVTDAEKFLNWCIERKRTDLLLPNEKVIAALVKAQMAQAKFDGIRVFKQTSTAKTR